MVAFVDKRTSQEYRISRPGARNSETRPANTPFLELLNELGTEGWELASEMAYATALVNLYGWSNVGQPVDHRWIFKRSK